ncbi:MAG: hypothetical protein V1809_14110, partial [Planctomycetota bacterium]
IRGRIVGHKIESSSPRKTNPGCILVPLVSYEWNGARFENQEAWNSILSFAGKAQCEYYATTNLPIGKQVEIFCNPKNPEHISLTRGIRSSNILASGFCFLVAIAPWILIYLGKV